LCLPARPYDFRAKPTHIVATFNMRSYVSGATGTGIELPVAYQHQSASAPTPPPHKKPAPHREGRQKSQRRCTIFTAPPARAQTITRNRALHPPGT